MPHRSIYIGYDPREHQAFTVARWSANQHSSVRTKVHGIALQHVQSLGWYNRPTKVDEQGRAIDVISEAPMSTEFAITRFLVPELVRKQGKGGWALFMDCDVLVRRDLDWLFWRAEASPDKALFCVQHDHKPDQVTKMDGRVQQQYARKNWSSVMLLNVDHPANQALTIDLINTVPGRDLHRFCWLEDQHIGWLPHEWNYLVGYSQSTIDPAIVHWTSGGPWFPQYANAPFADEWRDALQASIVEPE